MSNFGKFLLFADFTIGGANFALWAAGLGTTMNLIAAIVCVVAGGLSLALIRRPA